MSKQLLEALELMPANESWSRSGRQPLTLNIDLFRQHSQDNVPCIPKTPRSMLSPLTPKKKKDFLGSNFFSSTLDKSYCNKSRRKMELENEPYAVLLMIDITSLLGRKLLGTFSRLNLHNYSVVDKYERLCNGETPQRDDESRVLRSLEGRTLTAYKKRLCHRHHNRSYLFKASERRERSRTLLAGGLNRNSRQLLRRMMPCFLPLEKIDRNGLEPVGLNTTDELLLKLTASDAVPTIRLTRLPAFLNQFAQLSPESSFASQEKQPTAGEAEEADPTLTPLNCLHRKSVRRRTKPQRLLHAI